MLFISRMASGGPPGGGSFSFARTLLWHWELTCASFRSSCCPSGRKWAQNGYGSHDCLLCLHVIPPSGSLHARKIRRDLNRHRPLRQSEQVSGAHRKSVYKKNEDSKFFVSIFNFQKNMNRVDCRGLHDNMKCIFSYSDFRLAVMKLSV